MATAALTRYTPEEYLALERRAEFKSEYIDGRIVAMSGASPEHADIVLNLGSELRARLLPRGCRVFVNDVRVKAGRAGGYLYPDVVALCGSAEFEDTVPPNLLNPNLVIEVLSDSTEAFDRGEKFEAYRGIPALTEYVLIAQDRVSVERYVRQGDFWVYSAECNLDATVEFASIGCTMSLREIYLGVDLTDSFARERSRPS